MTRPKTQDGKSLGDRIREVVETLGEWVERLGPRPAPVPVPVPVPVRRHRR